MTDQKSIRHVWFDFTDTIAAMDRAAFENIVYTAYSDVVKKPITPELIVEYKALVKEKKSNAAAFASLGLPSSFLSDHANDRRGLYHLTDSNIPRVIGQLKDKFPVSVFSNTRLDTILPDLGIELTWFTHLLGPDTVKNPKPALDGFNKMIELSRIPANQILYIGDDVEKDLSPAKQVGIQTGLLWKESNDADHCFKDFIAIAEFFEVKN